VDLASSSGNTIGFALPPANRNFQGYATNQTPGCIWVSYGSATTLPPAGAVKLCPDETTGPCQDNNWENPVTPIAQAQPPSSLSPTFPASCGTIDNQISDPNF
jgi:hypothetical protein